MSLPTCPTGCTSNLPTVDFSLCAPEINQAQIGHLYFTTVGNPLANWASEVEWDSRLDNDAAGATAIRSLIGIGDWPAPESEEKEISLGRKVFGTRKFTINFRIDETNATNHAAFREMQCNTGNYLVWVATRDGLLWGGSSGINAKIKVDQVVPEAYSEIITYQITITWEAQFMPERIETPITDATGDQF